MRANYDYISVQRQRIISAFGFYVIVSLLSGCSAGVLMPEAWNITHKIEEPTVPVCGKIRFIANGEELKWGAVFDRPTPELFNPDTGKFISRIALSGGGLFAEAINRNGTFCWRLNPGKYLISRIFPFQDDLPAGLDDPAKFVFPGIAFMIPDTSRPVYLGTLNIKISMKKGFMANRRMTGKPAIDVLDEFETGRLIVKDMLGIEPDKKLMFRVSEIEGVPFHPKINMPAFLLIIPRFLSVLPHQLNR